MNAMLRLKFNIAIGEPGDGLVPDLSAADLFYRDVNSNLSDAYWNGSKWSYQVLI